MTLFFITEKDNPSGIVRGLVSQKQQEAKQHGAKHITIDCYKRFEGHMLEDFDAWSKMT